MRQMYDMYPEWGPARHDNDRHLAPVRADARDSETHAGSVSWVDRGERGERLDERPDDN